MQSSEPDAELLALVKAAIAELAPAAQAACDLEYICDALTSLGCMRLIDLELFINVDILIAQAALAPTPIAFLLTLKRLALAALAGSAASTTPGSASPAPGASPSFTTPMGAGTLEALLEPPRVRSGPSLGRFPPDFGMLLDLCSAHAKEHEKTRLPYPRFDDLAIDFAFVVRRCSHAA